MFYSRFWVYKMFKDQDSFCASCDEKMNLHDMEISNITMKGLQCTECCEKQPHRLFKEKITEFDFISNNVLETRETFKFQEPIIVTPDISYIDRARDFEEDEDDLDPEFQIESSWYHRAMLGDEKREIYTDGKDTDWEEEEKLWRELHESIDTDDNHEDMADTVWF
jgi:hypothetical protein